MLDNMKFLFEKVWVFFTMKLNIDGYKFEIWHPYAFAIIVTVILKMIFSDIEWYWNYKINDNRMEVMRNMKYTQWHRKQQRQLKENNKRSKR